MASSSSSMAPQEVPTLKILLIGTSSVGKSSLLLRYTDDEYLGPEEATATIGVDYKTKSIVVAGKRYKLNIWDTAGQERFRTLTSSYYRGAQGVIITYDVSNKESFDALPTWFDELDTFTSRGAASDIVKIVVGNKIDKEYARVVSTEEGRRFAEERGCLFVECSAKKGVGVNGAFDDLVNRIISTPSLWQDPVGARPGDRMPGGAHAEHAAGSNGGSISLNDATGRDEQDHGDAAGNGVHDEQANGAEEASGRAGAHDHANGGDDDGPPDETTGTADGQDADEDDFLDPSLLGEATLPISNISRLMKKALPRQAKVSSSAKDLIQSCCIEFIAFLTSEANDKCLLEKRKTINGDDILFAMKALGFDEYEIVCRIWLSRYRMALEMANRLKDRDGGSTSRGQGTSKQSVSAGTSVQGDDGGE